MSPESLANIVNRNGQTENQPTNPYFLFNCRQNLTSTNINLSKRLFMSDENNLDEFETRSETGHEVLDIFPKEFGTRSEIVNNESAICLMNVSIYLKRLGEGVTFDKIPDKEMEVLGKKVQYIYALGIYEQNPASRELCQKYYFEHKHEKPDVGPEDIKASYFSINRYIVNREIAENWEVWDKGVDKFHQYGMKVIVDFVTNHIGKDSELVKACPSLFLQTTKEEHEKNPDKSYLSKDNEGIDHYIVYGGGPYDRWQDVSQLNFGKPETHKFIIDTVKNLYTHSDGLRLDMAMLPLIFSQTWKDYLTPEEIEYSNNHNLLEEIASINKDKTLIAEAYEGGVYPKFEDIGKHVDYIYNGGLLKHLDKLNKNKDNEAIPDEVRSSLDFLINGYKQGKRNYKLVDYSENHDEPTSIELFGDRDIAFAMSTLVCLIPDNMSLVNYNQLEGRRLRQKIVFKEPISEKLDPIDNEMVGKYDRLFELVNCNLLQNGEWSILPRINSYDDPRIYTYKVAFPNDKRACYISINLSDHYAWSHIPEITKEHKVKCASLTDNKQIFNIDSVRDKNQIVVGLKKGAVEIFFVESPEKT